MEFPAIALTFVSRFPDPMATLMARLSPTVVSAASAVTLSNELLDPTMTIAAEELVFVLEDCDVTKLRSGIQLYRLSIVVSGSHYRRHVLSRTFDVDEAGNIECRIPDVEHAGFDSYQAGVVQERVAAPVVPGVDVGNGIRRACVVATAGRDNGNIPRSSRAADRRNRHDKRREQAFKPQESSVLSLFFPSFRSVFGVNGDVERSSCSLSSLPAQALPVIHPAFAGSNVDSDGCFSRMTDGRARLSKYLLFGAGGPGESMFSKRTKGWPVRKSTDHHRFR